MPCIKCSVNQLLTNENKQRLRDGFIDAIQLIPGKTADSVMVILEEGKDLYFHQSAELKIAFIEVNMLLRSDPTEYFSPMSKKICELLSKELGISGANVYIRYLATPDWGWNGRNF
ncbi:MAG: hypothetical protein HFF83_13340 [Oscillibacter sp.]|nr:hypothetical protein [Oscillibacter sp.]